MAIAMRHLATICFLFGAASFILGVLAENLKPDSGTPVQEKDVVICKYSSASYRYVLFGFMSHVFLVLSIFVGFRSLSFAYNKKAIPGHALYASSTMRVFFFITWLWSSWGMAFILWPTVTQLLHQMRNVHKDMLYQCPTAKTGMLGGGALLALTSSLLWLVCLMLAKNAREDYFEEVEEAQKGEQDQIINFDYQDLPFVSVMVFLSFENSP